MSMLKRVATVFCCALFFTFFAARADQWNKKTILTFNVPIEIPGKVLPAGTYVFKLADSNADRHIVQVFNEEENEIYATILAIPNYRLQPTGHTVVHFAERAANTPQAIRAWFYPGDSFGQEFVYPTVRATQLAEAAHQPVLAAEVTPTETPQELEKAPVVAVTPERKEVEMTQEVQAKPAETPAPAPVPAPAPPAPVQELPKTGSQVPLLVLLGLGSLGVAVLLGAVSKRIA
jgi:LPXTG-motif cell wall-anchored protein